MKEKIRLKQRYLLMWVMAWLIGNGAVRAQNMLGADPVDTYSLQTIFVNPAVVSFQPRQIAVGMRIYQLGFLNGPAMDFRNGYFSFTWPEMMRGAFDFGVTGQNFSTSLYDQTNFSLQFARRSLERVFVGLKYNVFSKSYHEKNFDLVNPNDPVFAGGTVKLAHSLGLGVVAFPWSHLAVGFSCDHLNRPNVALGREQYRLPMTYDFGVRYSYRYFSSSIYFDYFSNYWQFNWMFEARPMANTTFKFGYVQRAAKFEAQFYLFNGFSVNYIFDYPLYEINELSDGSHQISFLTEFKHPEKLRELQITRFDKGKVPMFDLVAQFDVDIATDRLEIVSERTLYSKDDRIPETVLRDLALVEPMSNDSSDGRPEVARRWNGFPGKRLNRMYSYPKYSAKYGQYLVQVAQRMVQPDQSAVDFITNFYSLPRAMTLRDSMLAGFPSLRDWIHIKSDSSEVEAYRLPSLVKDNTVTIKLEPSTVSFKISSLKMRKYRNEWKLIISDYSGKVVKTFRGKNPVPDEIVWDWRDDDGKLIPPDVYGYQFHWQNERGSPECSPRKTFLVKKTARTIHVDFRFQPDQRLEPGSSVGIKLLY
ncbi:MAG: type IX secretion system membrane protein PorP/SprF [candidate division KSB1 bacterium]|nr:type IX secretion system membrane protein PorP/SprF [candidate division KSB1 bacterium]MDZ7318751.1 type IX secretion system membrane protein PorP/SprF [candidate division KSB1 bacterium]MDZ7340797.1 type IX secretion system membrane protein PorP/SprF [candidate division KSB1 bacterium]